MVYFISILQGIVIAILLMALDYEVVQWEWWLGAVLGNVLIGLIRTENSR